MSIFKQLILGLLLPAVVGGIFIFAKSLISQRESEHKEDWLSGWLVAVALSAGYIVGYIGLEGLPPFPPREGVHWLCYLAYHWTDLGCFLVCFALGTFDCPSRVVDRYTAACC